MISFLGGIASVIGWVIVVVMIIAALWVAFGLARYFLPMLWCYLFHRNWLHVASKSFMSSFGGSYTKYWRHCFKCGRTYGSLAFNDWKEMPSEDVKWWFYFTHLDHDIYPEVWEKLKQGEITEVWGHYDSSSGYDSLEQLRHRISEPERPQEKDLPEFVQFKNGGVIEFKELVADELWEIVMDGKVVHELRVARNHFESGGTNLAIHKLWVFEKDYK